MKQYRCRDCQISIYMIVMITHGLPFLFFLCLTVFEIQIAILFVCQFILNFSLLIIANIQAVFNWFRVNIMASNHLETISDANSEMIYCCKNCEIWSKGAELRNRHINYDLNICSLTNKHILFINFAITFQIFINTTFTLRQRQRLYYRFFTFRGEKSNLIIISLSSNIF